MIPVTELRIGNLVDYEKTTHIVTAVQEDMVYSRWYKQSEEEGDYYDYPQNYHPIPLTPEILERCGCKRTGEYGGSHHYEIWTAKIFNNADLIFAFFDGERIFYEIQKDKDGKKHFIIIDYLHQWQNLYFSLSGKELKVSL